VRRLSGCLGELGAGQRRVLLLRAGIGPRPALTRAQVSRRLDASLVRVRRLERRGLQRLRAFERAGGCGSAAGGYSVMPSTGSFVGPGGESAVRASFNGADGLPGGATGSGGQEAEPRSDVKDEFEQSRPVPPATFIPRSPDGDGLDLTLVALLLGAGMFAYAVRRELSHR
jgi:hypothetical protein